MPTVLGVEAGLSALIQIKAVSWAVRAAVTKYHPLGAFQQTWVPPSLGGWKFKIRQIPWPVSCVLTVSSRTGKLLTNGRSSLSVYVSELQV